MLSILRRQGTPMRAHLTLPDYRHPAEQESANRESPSPILWEIPYAHNSPDRPRAPLRPGRCRASAGAYVYIYIYIHMYIYIYIYILSLLLLLLLLLLLCIYIYIYIERERERERERDRSKTQSMPSISRGSLTLRTEKSRGNSTCLGAKYSTPQINGPFSNGLSLEFLNGLSVAFSYGISLFVISGVYFVAPSAPASRPRCAASRRSFFPYNKVASRQSLLPDNPFFRPPGNSTSPSFTTTPRSFPTILVSVLSYMLLSICLYLSSLVLLYLQLPDNPATRIQRLALFCHVLAPSDIDWGPLSAVSAGSGNMCFAELAERVEYGNWAQSEQNGRSPWKL